MRRTRAIAGAASLAAIALAAQVTAADQPAERAPECDGRRATIVGTAGDDVLRGTLGRDVIWAGPGDDVVRAESGNDVVCGGAGTDLLLGGRNNDRLDGGPGDGDRVHGGLGDDEVRGGPGNGDEAGGDLGIDYVDGGPGDRDLVHGDYGWDRMDGGPGRGDVASFATATAQGAGAGVWVSLRRKKARGDGRDRLFGFEAVEGSAFADVLRGDRGANLLDGGAGNDRLFGGGGRDSLAGGQGTDRCRGGPERDSCGEEPSPSAPSYVLIDRSSGGGGGLQLIGGAGQDDLTVSFDSAASVFTVTSKRPIATGEGCARPGDGSVLDRVVCDPGGPARWLTADLGPGDDRLRIAGSLEGVTQLRYAGGPGDDVIRGGAGGELIESGSGADRLYGGAGSDGLVGGLPGPTVLNGGAHGDLVAAGGGCAGGALIGGGGRDNGSFAETGAHPGTLYVSLPRGRAWIDAVEGCRPVRLARSIEDIEGSFDNDVLIGDARGNAMLGQPGHDVFYGGGGDDVVNALDGLRDKVIQCGITRREGEVRRRSGYAVRDRRDPRPVACSGHALGDPTPGLHQ